MKLVNRIAFVIAASACLALALSGVASAHGTPRLQYNNSWAWVSSGHHEIRVMDGDGNHRELWAEYNVRDSRNRVTYGGIVKDRNGSLGGGGRRVLRKEFGRYRYEISSYRICEANSPPRVRDLGKHCTDWRGT